MNEVARRKNTSPRVTECLAKVQLSRPNFNVELPNSTVGAHHHSFGAASPSVDIERVVVDYQYCRRHSQIWRAVFVERRKIQTNKR